MMPVSFLLSYTCSSLDPLFYFIFLNLFFDLTRTF